LSTRGHRGLGRRLKVWTPFHLVGARNRDPVPVASSTRQETHIHQELNAASKSRERDRTHLPAEDIDAVAVVTGQGREFRYMAEYTPDSLSCILRLISADLREVLQQTLER
jgi:hypothetical protein